VRPAVAEEIASSKAAAQSEPQRWQFGQRGHLGQRFRTSSTAPIGRVGPGSALRIDDWQRANPELDGPGACGCTGWSADRRRARVLANRSFVGISESRHRGEQAPPSEAGRLIAVGIRNTAYNPIHAGCHDPDGVMSLGIDWEEGTITAQVKPEAAARADR